jgi:tRNA(fMet)-specific endonuclease VapC
MDGKRVLDTNAVVHILNGKLDPPRLGFDEVIIPMTVVGELFFGVHNSARVAENRRRLLTLLDLVSILPPDIKVAERYGELKLQLRSIGKPIPDNDMWIAATALEHGLPIVTNDKHFTYIEGLEIVRY